ncbi:LPS assembly protein LptD [Providencia rettgeri]|uniref:LPS assembly protein LptD n=1 Tax=Providencia rettgeri TaxID=587 RepID=UPI0013739784|nr:LPS assembly protein LptD [Providencia rettgeri]MCG9525058.1 LPS assembly protein LptD [Providencia rettgeri]BBV05553.1 LPS-assembly protein LptD [Providencia rettgeri]
MMKKSYPTLLATMVWAAIYSQQAHADLAQQCMLGVPVYTKPIVKGDPNDLPIHITAEDVRGEYPNFVEYEGNVDIQQGNQTLTADKVKLTQTETAGELPVREVTATGNVHYDDPQIILKGPSAWSNLDNKNTDVNDGNYMMVGRQGRGDATKMKMRGENRYSIMENGTFTTCLPGNNSWSVAGSEVIIDREEEVAEIWHARFKVGDVPIFYSPYMQLPIGNKRRSGFLIPTGSYSSNDGLEFSLPYYWNIAPNYDATITPQFMTHRGVKLNNEFRYLIAPGTGTVAFDFLNHDRAYIKDKERGKREDRDSDDRWLFYWRHSGTYAGHWNFSSDYTKVSDPSYFTDFSSQYGNTTDGYATQKFSAGYSDTNWNAKVTHKQFQIFADNPNKRAYKAEPQVDFNYYKNNLGAFDVHTYAQAARFTSVGKNNPDATRLHIEPEVNLPLSNGWANMNNSIKLYATHYDQDIPRSNTDKSLEKNVTRVLPMFKSDAKVVFERDLFQGSDFVQTLEPRVQYLYIPYKDQDNINNFDSSLLQSDYSGLFRDRIYSGLDRIASANQFTTGVTTRVYDDALAERFNFSVGQIYYFERPRAGDSNRPIDDKSNTGSLLWATDSMWRIDDNWGLRGGLQYDRRLGNVTMGNAVAEYRLDADRLVQLNYRFVDRDYIQATFRDLNQLGKNQELPEYQRGISQVGAVVSWPLSERWGFVGSYYYDTKQQQPASQLVGLQYNTCCWAVNLGYERKIVGWQKEKFSSEYDNKWSINVELRGLNNNHSLGSQKMLESGIMPYQRAF